MRKVIFVILAIGMLFLTGCFDRIDRIKINKDGSGIIVLKTMGDPSFLEDLPKSIASPSSKIRKLVKEGKFSVIEEANFKNLEELNYTVFSFSLRCKKKALLPFKPSLFQFRAKLKKDEDLDEELRDGFLSLNAPLLSGYFYQVVIEVPGEIVKAHPIIIEDMTIEPTVEENSVSWKFPLSLFFPLYEKKAIFCLDFKAKMNLPKGKIVSFSEKKLLRENHQEREKEGEKETKGVNLVVKANCSHLPLEVRKNAVQKVAEIITNRLRLSFSDRKIPFGVYLIGENEILIQASGKVDRGRMLFLIGKTGYIEFKLVSDDAERLKQALEGNIPSGYELKYLNGKPLLLQKDAVLTGNDLSDAKSGFSQNTMPAIYVRFNNQGSKKLGNITRNNVGRRLAIILDGKIESAPVIREPILTGEAEISGRFTADEAENLALILRAGALPCPSVLEEERTILGPIGFGFSYPQGIVMGVKFPTPLTIKKLEEKLNSQGISVHYIQMVDLSSPGHWFLLWTEDKEVERIKNLIHISGGFIFHISPVRSIKEVRVKDYPVNSGKKQNTKEIKHLKGEVEAILKNLNKPEYLPSKMGVAKGYWVKFWNSAKQKQYDELYYAALDEYSYVVRACHYANKFLAKGDVKIAKKYIEEATEYLRTMNDYVSASYQLYQKGVVGAYKNSRFTTEVLAQAAPWSAKIVDGLYLYLDYSMDEAMYGQGTAKRKLIIKGTTKAVAELVFNFPIKELEGKSINKIIREKAAEKIEKWRFSSFLDEVFHNPKFKKDFIKAVSQVGTTSGETISGKTASSILETMMGEIGKK